MRKFNFNVKINMHFVFYVFVCVTLTKLLYILINNAFTPTEFHYIFMCVIVSTRSYILEFNEELINHSLKPIFFYFIDFCNKKFL